MEKSIYSSLNWHPLLAKIFPQGPYRTGPLQEIEKQAILGLLLNVVRYIDPGIKRAYIIKCKDNLGIYFNVRICHKIFFRRKSPGISGRRQHLRKYLVIGKIRTDQQFSLFLFISSLNRYWGCGRFKPGLKLNFKLKRCPTSGVLFPLCSPALHPVGILSGS